MTPEPDYDPGPARRRRRRILLRLAALVLLALAGSGAWLAAREATARIETRATRAAQAALAESGQAWAGVEADGLQVTLTGTAPDEAARLRAIAAVGDAVAPARLLDAVGVTAADAPPPPPFEVEILANADGVSLVGLVPVETDAATIRDRLAQAGAPAVTDLLTRADRPVADSWAPAFGFGLDAVGIAPRAKISIQPGKVAVAAIAADAEEKTRIEQALLAGRPGEVALSMDIRAPLPVIAPFTLRYVLDGDGRLEACAADSAEARDAILAAADAQGDCPLGLGAPSPDWSRVAVAAIGALKGLGAGAVTLTDHALRLEVPQTVPLEALDRAAVTLRNSMPPPYRLEARQITAATAPEAVRFTASRAHPGAPALLRGQTTNDQMRAAIETVARARFGSIDAALTSDEAAPAGWTVRVVAGIEALSRLNAGMIAVTPDLVQVEGISGDHDAARAVIAGLAARLGEGANYSVQLAYDRRLDPSLGLPDGDTCVARLNAVLDGAGLRFAPSGAAFEGDVSATLAALAEAMRDCGDYRIEIGGHTDSQGSEDFNAQLSQKRAEAVLAAMAEAGIPAANLTAQGYGESQPVAGNETDTGRERNRRIEMRLVSPAPVSAAPPEPGPLLTGVTGPAESEAEAAGQQGYLDNKEAMTVSEAGAGKAGDAAPVAGTGSATPDGDEAAATDTEAGAAAAGAGTGDPETASPSEEESEDEGDAAEVPSGPAPGYSAGETSDGGPRPPQRPVLDPAVD